MPAVIYAHTKRHAEQFALGLAEAGIEDRPYHAGMAASVRDAVQDAFMGGTLPVICATVAFGMGVDKPDIRTGIHAGVPSSVSAYAQEAGRAGRDAEAASCVVFFSEEELEARRDSPPGGAPTPPPPASTSRPSRPWPAPRQGDPPASCAPTLRLGGEVRAVEIARSGRR